jgi:uncharacterized protein DUF4411
MSKPRKYLLDSDVFITAKNAYYAFPICPGFWDSLIHHHSAGSVFSIDKVQSELLVGRPKEDLVKWVNGELADGFFHGTGGKDVTGAYSQIMLWAQRNAQYTAPAKAKFATEADGWLVAYAGAHRHTVVTNEQPQPESKSRILLPDVCDQFRVPYLNTFEMLKELAVRYEWRTPTRKP